MRYIFLLTLLLGIVQPLMSQVTRLEYFIDNDPGQGNGAPISITAGNDIQQNLTLPLTNVQTGYHILYVRAMDAQGLWSLTARHTFYTLPTAGNTITAAEYFFDTDPGAGMGTTLPVTGSANIVQHYAIPLSNLPYGFHTLFMRTRDNENHWSLTLQKVFYLDQSSDTARIKAFDYQFERNGVVFTTNTYTLPAPSAAVDLNFTANLSGLEPEREYTMHIWAVTNTGQKSLVHKKQVKVCSGSVAKAGFDFIATGTTISIIDSAAGASRYTWQFGDGTIDSVSNPVHTYANGGQYNIRQIVSNFCNSDTITKTVHALSLQSMSPAKGGNTGSVTVNIIGGGFTQATIVKLVNGSQEIKGLFTAVSDSGKILQATFELYNQQPGLWNLQVINTGNILNMANAFAIEPGAQHNLTVAIEGRQTVRRNVSQRFTFTVSNNSNIDAKGVILWIAVPHNTNVTPVNFKLAVLKNMAASAYNSKAFYQTDSLFDEPVNADVSGYILRNVPASGEVSLEFDLAMENDGTVYAWTSEPMYGSPFNEDTHACLLALNDLVDVIGIFYPPLGCIKSAIDESADLYDYYKKTQDDWSEWERIRIKYEIRSYKGDVSTIDQVEEYTGVMLNKYVLPVFPALLKLGWDCFKFEALANKIGFKPWFDDAGTVLGQNIANARTPHRIITKEKGQLVWKKIKAVAEIPFEFRDHVQNGGAAYGLGWNTAACMDWIRKTNYWKQTVTVVASMDPNEKTGPAGIYAKNHIQGLSPVNYTIYFENVDTATAPAQEVIVLDTLDKSKFDLSTFTLQSFGFGDSVRYPIPGNLALYATNVLIKRPGKANLLVRVDAKLDTATGVLKWRFLSLDPTTREMITDPLDGFLPPNKNRHEGEGFIGYSVNPKTLLGHGTTISNKALIYFDNNAPIITNTFINTIDKAKPASAINPLPAQSADTTFLVEWQGADNDAGVRSYDIFYAVNNGPFRVWLYDASTKKEYFNGKKDSLYKFYSIAKDYAGNIENNKTQAEASILVGKVTGINDPQGEAFVVRTFPNPATATVWVELSLPQPEPVRIVIRDLQGKEIGTIANRLFTTGTHKLEWDVRHLPAGIYILEFNSKKFRKSSKLVKQ